MKQSKILLTVLLITTSQMAFAKENQAVKKAESDMMAACKKEYASAVKGKSFAKVAEWVETEERGANAKVFKKSKCYILHEKWEGVSDREETDERENY